MKNADGELAADVGCEAWFTYMHYNFARIYQTLRVTPAMEAKISDRVWSLEEIAGLSA